MTAAVVHSDNYLSEDFGVHDYGSDRKKLKVAIKRAGVSIERYEKYLFILRSLDARTVAYRPESESPINSGHSHAGFIKIDLSSRSCDSAVIYREDGVVPEPYSDDQTILETLSLEKNWYVGRVCYK